MREFMLMATPLRLKTLKSLPKTSEKQQAW